MSSLVHIRLRAPFRQDLGEGRGKSIDLSYVRRISEASVDGLKLEEAKTRRSGYVSGDVQKPRA